MIDLTQPLHDVFGSRLKENEPLAKHTNFRIGGPARWMVEARNEGELKEALVLTKANDVPIFVMGGGSNILASDAGFSGLIFVMGMRGIKIGSETDGDRIVTAEAGAMSAALARATVDVGLQGLEWMISLPGTVGGAVRGNAGCFGGETKDVLKSVRVLRCVPPLPEGGQWGVGACNVIELSDNDLEFGYRESALKRSDDILLSVTFKLRPGNKTELQKKMNLALGVRKAKQPLYAGSAGCIFKNYEYADEAEIAKLKAAADVPEEMLKAKRIGAGWIVDRLDLKGTRIGRAEVSREHGNFIINTGGATADDVIQLIALIKTRARNEFGITLREEVQYVGFD